MGNIHIKNKKELEQKINSIKKDGKEKLYVVTDFDMTLTRCFIKGKKILSTIALIRNGNYLRDNYSSKAYALFDKYHPIEIDNSSDYNFRYKKMEEWWTKHLELIITSGMNKKVIDDIISKNPKTFRQGTMILFNKLNEEKIPVLIFSAGIGNIIEGLLKQKYLLQSNIHISQIFLNSMK